jgi:hypothetical protein
MDKPIETEPADLRKKIARYRRSLAVMNDPGIIRMIEGVLKEMQERLEAAESR